ncbi:unnamed protein product [Penicillium salamii]|uniref:Zn(2)-C6 fungal-type domain-containing protein n=1 Tax=Penicillium salamii TaxID=1612424 RepID=A0A9W4NIT3_9EURO|nr:unnamed protein product [Penicillium salamii]
MAPSTSNPTNLHRAPIACLQCREGKVRCLVSLGLERCDRCITNNTECVFAESKRARVQAQPHPQRKRRVPGTPEEHRQGSFGQNTHDDEFLARRPPQSGREDGLASTYRPCSPGQKHNSTDNIKRQKQQPAITNATRGRLIAAFATIRGERGSPFTFVTSGESPSFSVGNSNDHTPNANSQQSFFHQSEESRSSLRLLRILRPLKPSINAGTDEDDWRPTGSVKMPSYISSMTLGHTVVDPIKSGILSPQLSERMFEFFMIQMNAKWEYLLDPYVDTHDSVQMRSPLLFAAILYCSSKFANFTDGKLVSNPDLFFQSRLCSLARNLAIKSIAEGNRSIETMQAFYLLVCWKDADDDVSYLHSSYAFRILHDLDSDPGDSGSREFAMRKRTWLALFRQDRQQSLFFMRRASLSPGEENITCNLGIWTTMPYALPSDFAACCSADLRCIQSRLRHMVQKGSPDILPCLLELMDADLRSWKSRWSQDLEEQKHMRTQDHPISNPALLSPGGKHFTTLLNVWDNSVRLNVASAILRQALMASVSSIRDLPESSPVDIDLRSSNTQQILSQNLPGLTSSVEGAFGTLRHLMRFPPNDLRLAPDAILLLVPNTALFLCLLLCLPGNGILGHAFQKTTLELIQNITQHIRTSVQSPQDTVALHLAYLESLVELLGLSEGFSSQQAEQMPPQFDTASLAMGTARSTYANLSLEASQQSIDTVDPNAFGLAQSNAISPLVGDCNQTLHMQSLANLLDGQLFWELPSGNMNANFD